jgi:MFS family permease
MPHFENTIGNLSPVMRGFTVALIMMTAALPCIFSGQLADRFGQLTVVMAGALVFTIGVALEGGSSELAMFLVGRALAGIGEGLWLSNVSVYVRNLSKIEIQLMGSLAISQKSLQVLSVGLWFPCRSSCALLGSVLGTSHAMGRYKSTPLCHGELPS